MTDSSIDKVRDLLKSAGVQPSSEWRAGMISTHEIRQALNVSEAQAGRILRQLRDDPEFETVRAKHPVSGRNLYAVIRRDDKVHTKYKPKGGGK